MAKSSQPCPSATARRRSTFRCCTGTHRPRRDRRPRAVRQDRRCSPTTRASCRPRAAARRSPTSTATRACCCTAATRSSSSREHCDFLEVALPDAERRAAEHSSRRTSSSTSSPTTPWCTSSSRASITGFRRDAHPMAVMCGVVGALSAFYHDSLDINDPQHREISAFRLIAKLPTITAMTYKYNIGQPFMYPKNDLSYVENFLHMMFGDAVRGVQAQPGADARDGPHPHPARRPRAERLDLDGAPGGLVRRQSRSPASPPASPACGARRTAARTKPC